MHLGCANLAHGFAACGADEKLHLRADRAPQRRDRLGLQRHALGASAVRALPRDPQEGRAAGRRRRAVRRRRARHVRRHHAGPRGHGAVALQPRRGRDGTAVALSPRHVRRRADARRVRQDRARAADRRAVASATCRPSSSPPARCRRGLPNGEKSRIRQLLRGGQGRPRRAAGGRVGSPTTRAGTCTFYGTANSNQLVVEAMGLHLPGRELRQPRHAAARAR